MSESDDAPRLIDRDTLFGNPTRSTVRLSPDGTKIAYRAPEKDVMNVWVAPADNLDAARAVTHDRDQGIQWFNWAHNNEDILYSQDEDGNEQWHVYAVDVESGETRDLTPWDNIKASIQELSPQYPNEILCSVNKRNPKYHEIYRIDLETGESERIQDNEQFAGFVTDDDFDVRFAQKSRPDGGTTWMRPDGEGGWTTFMKLSRADAMSTQPVSFNKEGDVAYLFDSRGRDTAALTAVDLESGDKKVLFETDEADVNHLEQHPKTKDVQAASYTYARENWHALDDSFGEKLETLQNLHEGNVNIVSRTHDNSRWIVAYEQDDGPLRYYRFDADEQESEFLFVHRPELKDLPLAEMEPVTIESRDGFDLVNYLMLPPWKTDDSGEVEEPLPLIIKVHGGPWWRDKWGWDPVMQWLANRGYAVMSVNFRGSTGFGKEFLNAGNKEWGRKMHHDILDARQWAIDQGLTTDDQVAIYGGSYGGYATLVGMTMTPDKFVAGVDLFGPSNLITLIEAIPPYWKPIRSMFTTRVGDPSTEEGRKLLKERSPIQYVDQIKHPLLIGQGANDPRVKPQESEQIVSAMQEKKLPVTYAYYPDEGHGFRRPENRMSFYAVTEHFLAEHLGGRAQALEGSGFEESSLHVPTGAGEIPSLTKRLCEAMPERCEKPKTPDKGDNPSKAAE